MNIDFSKIELRSGIFLNYNYTMTEAGRKTKIKANADAIVHDDLSQAIQALVPHYVLLTEMKKKPDVVKSIDLDQMPEDLLKKFKVKGVTIEDNKGDISYKISGYKILKNGRTVAFETPKISMNVSEEDQYEFFDKLEQQIELIKEEVLEYMDGKEAVVDQTKMTFGDDFNPENDEAVEKQEFEETAA